MTIFVTVGRVGGANIDIEQQVLEVTAIDKRERLVTILNELGLSHHSVPFFLLNQKVCKYENLYMAPQSTMQRRSDTCCIVWWLKVIIKIQ